MGGRRAGCVAHCLKLADRDDIPVAAGAGVSLTTLRRADSSTDDERYWPSTLVARPGSLGRAPVVVMGGWVQPPADGLPAWGPEMDFNVQWDTRSSDIPAAT